MAAGMNPWFNALNRGKRSIVLDMGNATGYGPRGGCRGDGLHRGGSITIVQEAFGGCLKDGSIDGGNLPCDFRGYFRSSTLTLLAWVNTQRVPLVAQSIIAFRGTLATAASAVARYSFDAAQRGSLTTEPCHQTDGG